MDNFCLPAQELKHLKLEFYHDTRVLKTQDAIFSHCFANITTNEIVKNLRPNGKKIHHHCLANCSMNFFFFFFFFL